MMKREEFRAAAEAMFKELGIEDFIPRLVHQDVGLSYRNDATRVVISTPLLQIIGGGQLRVTRACQSVKSWTLSGEGATNSAGQDEILLNRYLPCVDNPYGDHYLTEQPSFTATPVSETPAFLTIQIESAPLAALPAAGLFLGPDGTEINVRVRSWKADGQPHGNVRFKWICVVRGVDFFPYDG